VDTLIAKTVSHPIVAGDVIDAIGELLPRGEQLLEIAEAARHRLAPRVDDPGIRKNQVNETDVPEIVRHLVDESRLAGAIDACIGDILLAEPFEIFRSQALEDLGVARLAGIRVTSLHVGHEAQDVRQLRRALDL
jgi:hypothetical protein